MDQQGRSSKATPNQAPSGYLPTRNLDGPGLRSQMAIDDFQGEPVLTGTWPYDDFVRQRVSIVACNFDREHAWRLEEVEHVRNVHGEEMDPPGPPKPLGPDGVFYHVESSPQFQTIADAKAWAEAQPWGPIEWDALD